jgi:RHS repeat-associated protein
MRARAGGWCSGTTHSEALPSEVSTRDTYDRADHQLQIQYPAIANMAAETVTTAYNQYGSPVTLTGTSAYVSGTTFTNEGRPATRTLDAGTYAVTRSYNWDLSTGRLLNMIATQNGVTLQNDAETYDANGNLTSTMHDRAGTVFDHGECYSYDGRNRLITAVTSNGTPPAPNCIPSTSVVGAYNTSYSLDEIGNFTTGPAVGAYTYPASGPATVRPHAPTQAGVTTISYRADGSMKTNVTNGVTTTYGWDPLGHLSTVTKAGVTTQNMYQPGGERVLMKDTTGVHLYLGGLAERHANLDGTTTQKRFYTIGSTQFAVQTRISNVATSTLDYLCGDIRGSTALTIGQGTNTTSEQWYNPYGTVRGNGTITATTKGYIGQQQDTTTGLDYLHNRHYNPALGVFLSVDPLVVTTHDPYTYTNGNPTTLNDPSGLEPHLPGPAGRCEDASGTCVGGSNASGSPLPKRRWVVVDDLTKSRDPSSTNWSRRGSPSWMYGDDIVAASDKVGVNWNLVASVLDHELVSMDNLTGVDFFDGLADELKSPIHGNRTTLGAGQLNLAAVKIALAIDPTIADEAKERQNSFEGWPDPYPGMPADQVYRWSGGDTTISIRLTAAFLKHLDSDTRLILNDRGFEILQVGSAIDSNASTIRLSQIVATRYNVSDGAILPSFIDGGSVDSSRLPTRFTTYGGLVTERMDSR